MCCTVDGKKGAKCSCFESGAEERGEKTEKIRTKSHLCEADDELDAEAEPLDDVRRGGEAIENDVKEGPYLLDGPQAGVDLTVEHEGGHHLEHHRQCICGGETG